MSPPPATLTPPNPDSPQSTNLLNGCSTKTVNHLRWQVPCLSLNILHISTGRDYGFPVGPDTPVFFGKPLVMQYNPCPGHHPFPPCIRPLPLLTPCGTNTLIFLWETSPPQLSVPAGQVRLTLFSCHGGWVEGMVM